MVDAPALEIDVARRIFGDAIAKYPFVRKFPIKTEIRQGAVPDATVIHRQWLLTEKGPYSREIAVQIAAGAMNHFRQAEARARGEMLERFIRTFRIRLIDGGYNEQDTSSPPFIVHIDEHSVEP